MVTGGAGFIGSNYIHYMFRKYGDGIRIINVDSLTYAGNLENLRDIEELDNYTFVKADITDKAAIERIFAENEAELLNECMKSVLLGMQSLDVVEKVAVGELNAYVKQQMGEYAALSERISDRMKQLDVDPEIYGSFKQKWQKKMVKLSIFGDKSNSNIAEKLIKGTNMGVTDLTRCLNENAVSVSDETARIASDVLAFFSGSVEALKRFL